MRIRNAFVYPSFTWFKSWKIKYLRGCVIKYAQPVGIIIADTTNRWYTSHSELGRISFNNSEKNYVCKNQNEKLGKSHFYQKFVPESKVFKIMKIMAKKIYMLTLQSLLVSSWLSTYMLYKLFHLVLDQIISRWI